MNYIRILYVKEELCMQNKIKEYSILRVILTLLVVLGHSAYLSVYTAGGGLHIT